MPIYETYLTIKQAATRLYTYLPKDNTATVDGLLSTALTENGWKKYRGRTGKETKEDVLKVLDSWEPEWNRSRAISVLSQPIPIDAAEDLRQFADESELYSFDLDDLIKANLVKNLRKTNKGPGTYAVDGLSKDKFNWNRKPKKLTFYGIPHYMVETTEGRIPSEFITKENKQDKYTIHGAILGCLGNNAKKFDYNITEKLPNDPWKAIINTKPMTMEQVQQFHKYHKKDVDKAGVPYYFLTRNERTGEKAVWYSDDPNPIPINNKKQVEQAKQIGISKGLVPDQLDFKFTKESEAINFPEDEIANLKGKDHFYTTRVSSDYNKYNLGDTVTTPWGDAYDIVSEDRYNNLKDHKFYDELTDAQKRLLAAYKKIKLLGLTKKSSVDISDIVNAYKDQYGFDLSHMRGKHSKKPRYNNGKVANDIPVDAYGGSWAKNNTIYLNPNMDAVAKYYSIADATGLQNTIVAHELAHEIYKRQATQEFIKQILEEAKKKKFTTPYLATVPEHKLDEETFCEYLANGLNKKASKLYTYVEQDADLSQGLLSLRNAPEAAVVRRYGHQIKEPENRTKEKILKWISDLGNDPGRPDWIYALDAPIPDNANEGLLRFRDARKLVSWDPEQVKDIIQILRRYNNPKTREEVSANFKPLKHIRWDKSTPTYKILTESGRIPPELLTYE